MTNTYEHKHATQCLRAAGYTITGYPDDACATNLIVRLGDRTVTTLPVKDGQVDGQSVDYLVDEHKREMEADARNQEGAARHA